MADTTFSHDDVKIRISGTYFSSVAGSDFTAVVTEFSDGGGDRDVEQIRCFGSGNNSYKYRKGMTMKEASVKFHLRNNDIGLAIMGGSFITGMPQQFTGDALKYPVDVTYEAIDRFDVSGAHFRANYANADATNLNWNMTAEGTLEGDGTFKCLPHDYTWKYTDNRVTSPLT